jgi:hypothetical protein
MARHETWYSGAAEPDEPTHGVEDGDTCLVCDSKAAVVLIVRAVRDIQYLGTSVLLCSECSALIVERDSQRLLARADGNSRLVEDLIRIAFDVTEGTLPG